MALTFGEFATKMRKVAELLPVRANAHKIQIVGIIQNDLLNTTPVDTGTAMSNWQVTANEPAAGIRDAFAPSPAGYMASVEGKRVWTHRVDPNVTRNANIGPAKAASQQVLESVKSGEPLYVTNNVPYIVPLNDGTPTQPARQFVARAILLAREYLTRAKVTG